MKIIWEKSPNRIITAEDLLSEHSIDLKERNIAKQKINKRDQAQNKKDGSTVIVELYQVLLELVPKHQLLAKDYKQLLKEVFSWDIPVVNTSINIDENEDILAQIIHTDLHFDRIDHKNPKKYLKEIDDRTMRLFEQLLKGKPSMLLYNQLWDYYNTDINQKTTKGTEQHNSIDELESFQMWLEHQLWLIKTFASELPVHAIYNPWNHDRNKLQYLSDAIQLYFSNSVWIDIDNSHKARKYFKRWNTLIWSTHWDGERIPKLPEIIPTDTKLWEHNYFFRWHSHTHDIKQFGKLIVETLGSPASPSKREKQQGYFSNNKIHGNTYDKKKGKLSTYYK